MTLSALTATTRTTVRRNMMVQFTIATRIRWLQGIWRLNLALTEQAMCHDMHRENPSIPHAAGHRITKRRGSVLERRKPALQ